MLFDEPDMDDRLLQEDMSINWATMGFMTPVKNQGGCGSCWSFSALTTQEAMQSIQTGASPVRLSEQEGVDCVSQSNGCAGGWMSHVWNWSRSGSGNQLNSSYPYQGSTKSCRNQGNSKVSKAAEWGRVSGVSNMKAMLQEGPMTIAVAADKCWQYYKEGVLSAANGCGSGINHGVVLVGLESSGGGTSVTTCKKASRKERRAKKCVGDEWKISANERGNSANRRCCKTTTEGGGEDYWVVQNSWGKNWGIDGFIHLAVENGNGVSQMNRYVDYMKVDPNF